MAAKKEKVTKSENQFLANLKIFVEAILIATIIRSFFFEPFHIPSGSMKDNLLEGDFIIVSKYTYGYSKYSFPFGIAPIEERVWADKPERGDVIVFRLPSNPRINYIKRLIGLPGDKIQMKNGRLFINDQAVPKEADGFYLDPDKGLIEKFVETLPEGKKYNVLDYVPNGAKDSTPVFEVPAGHYFFMGDNRDNSQDSRFLTKVGFVPERNLVGKARIIFMSSQGSLLKFWEWHRAIRFDRIFSKIE